MALKNIFCSFVFSIEEKVTSAKSDSEVLLVVSLKPELDKPSV